MQKTDAQVILSPVVTEKGTMIKGNSNTVCFKVLPDATKVDIARAIMALFKVKVKSVNTLNRKGKVYGGARRKPGRRAGYKKAFVTLLPGESIKMLEELF